MVLSSTDKQVVNSYNGNKILLNTDWWSSTQASEDWNEDSVFKSKIKK
jgi:hypothetical protein